jgi:predicted unusual protein kinase regulating ubiquinone biosynthesis (AarF/ABC1/UbiB family)
MNGWDDEGSPSAAQARAVPSGRLSRFGQFSRLAGGVASGIVAEGARRIASGERPQLRDLLLTPANVHRLTERLSHLRGAAMKLGQMISMDAGDMLPPELSQIMGRLRQNAHRMPPQQLQRVLATEWGADWRRRFAWFGATPLAAASIGQVHRARTPDGRDLAIKVQYPGVRESIDSDVDNVAALLRASGLWPRELDVQPLLAAAKTQLREEADYLREAEQIRTFGRLLAGAPDYQVPTVDEEFTTRQVLAMSYLEGEPIEALESVPQETRDAAMERLISLVLRELFEFGIMQTDPNFANYRHERSTGRLILLDFGAARQVSPEVSASYRNLLRALGRRDRDAVIDASLDAGFLGSGALNAQRPLVEEMVDVVVAEFTREGPFDFGDRAFVRVLRDRGLEVAADRSAWHLPPADILFAQRKISGTALLAARLRAKVDVRSLLSPYLAEHRS